MIHRQVKKSALWNSNTGGSASKLRILNAYRNPIVRSSNPQNFIEYPRRVLRFKSDCEEANIETGEKALVCKLRELTLAEGFDVSRRSLIESENTSYTCFNAPKR